MGKRKYQHNWDVIKARAKAENLYIVLISVVKERAVLGNGILESLRKRNDYYPWNICTIAYWINMRKSRQIKERNLCQKQ